MDTQLREDVQPYLRVISGGLFLHKCRSDGSGCETLHEYRYDGGGCETEYVWGTCVDLNETYPEEWPKDVV